MLCFKLPLMCVYIYLYIYMCVCVSITYRLCDEFEKIAKKAHSTPSNTKELMALQVQ